MKEKCESVTWQVFGIHVGLSVQSVTVLQGQWRGAEGQTPWTAGKLWRKGGVGDPSC